MLALAGCASAPQSNDTGLSPSSAPDAAAAPAPETELVLAPLPHLELPVPQALQKSPFAPAVAASLEELPLPAEDLWQRIRGGFELPTLELPEVAKWEQWYSSRPEYVARMIDRSRRYLYYVVVEVEKRHMPLEIALLPMVESAYNPNAVSTSKAAGMWQFIPSTGTLYGLKQNFWFDSRRDIVAATASALAYLDKLHAQFDDWQLALAAYNWGEGNVARAVERNRRLGLPTDYASLRLPVETRNYLPKLQAVKNIVLDPQRYGLQLGDIPDAPYFAVVTTTKQIDVKRAAELAEMSVDEFQYLNPHHNRPVIAGADEHTILLPIDKAELFAAKLDLLDQPLVSWQAYRMQPGDSLQQVAARFGMSADTLRAVNGVGADRTVPPGYAVLVPAQRDARASAETLEHAVFTTVPKGRTFYYRVTRGDTLTTIASRYAVSAADIQRWNGLSRPTVKPGQKLRITSSRAPAPTHGARGEGKPESRAPRRDRPRSPERATRRRARNAARVRRARPAPRAPPSRGSRR